MEGMIYGKVICERGGTGVGWRSASGANNLNFWKEKREGVSNVRNMGCLEDELCVTEIQVKRLRSDIMGN